MKRSAPLAWHQQTQSVVLLSSHPSAIQFYSPATESRLAEVEVLPTNRVSAKEQADDPIEEGRVQKVVFSADQSWMATFDTWQGFENNLKLWQWQSESQQ